MMREHKCVFVLILVALPLLIARGFAQTERGSISGVIKDPTSAVVPGAKVVASLQNPNSQSARNMFEVTTDNEGTFRFDNVPTGIYQLAVTSHEFKPDIKKGVRVHTSRTTETSFRLKFIQPCEGSSASDDATDSDKGEIIRLVLEDALIKKTLPDLGMLVEGKERIILSTKNIKTSWVPSLPKFKLVLLSPTEIQEKADREGDFLHLSFSELKIRGSCVAVTIANSWAVARNSRMGYLSGGGSTYEFHKQSGKWVGKMVSGWIS
jgi:hypothetical protein